MKIGFVGIGQMGREMSVRLIDAGHDLVVWNRSPAASRKLGDRAASIETVRGLGYRFVAGI